MEEFTDFDRPFGLCKLDAELLKSFNSSLKDLRGLILSNIEFYQRGRSALHARFYASFCILLERSQILEPLVFEIIPNLCRFDFSEEVPGNGYRSFISLIYRCCLYLLQLCRHIHTSKASLFFQSARYCKDLECYVETLGQLTACLHYLKQLMSYCTDGELFLLDDSVVGDSLLLQLEMINTDCFYGRCVGFQFSQSIQKALQAVMVLMATFSECYEEPSQVMQIASSLLNSGKYVIDQELRARQVVNITRTGDIKFCKAFWSLPESPILAQLLSFTYPYVEVSDVISLDPVNFELPSTCSEETVTITPPCAHTGPAAVHVRLISHALREGQDSKRKRFKPKSSSSKSVILPKSTCLLFHCHGGGFVSQSSKSHESYLRTWALELEVPILSVDYSLAPDLPFPRALEECFYAYAWALKNPSKLGWTGERVCFAGDSAGANLVISTALRAVYFEIRVPDGIMSAYAPVMIQYTPSPARFMSMIDPLLPVGILMRCLAAYAGIADELSSALAKPIFCNPGNVETWEMVDSTDAPHVEDYIGEVPNNLDSINDGAEKTHVIDSNTIQSDISINPEESRTSTTKGCETKHESTNDSSAGVLADDIVMTSDVHKADDNCTDKTDQSTQETVRNHVSGSVQSDRNDSLEMNEQTESKLPVHYVSDASSDSDCMFVDEKFETVIVDSDMVPIDVQTNEQHSKSFISSRLFNYIKKDNPVKSFVSGFKSLISKPAKNQTTNKGQTGVESNSALKKQQIVICDSEQISTDNSNCTDKTDQSTQDTVRYHVSGSVQSDRNDSLEADEQTECNTKMADKHVPKCGVDTHENNDKLNADTHENNDKLNELVPETENNHKLNELVPETGTSSFSLSLFSTTTTTTGCDINTPVSHVDSKRSIDVSDHDKENPVAPKMANVTESLLDNINSLNGADVSDHDKENPVAPKMANVTESLLDNINSRNGADVSDHDKENPVAPKMANVTESLLDNINSRNGADVSDHDKENPVALKMANVTESLLDNINSRNGADVSDHDQENPTAPKMANVTESVLENINSPNGADVSDLVLQTLSCENDKNISEHLHDNGSPRQCSDATEVVNVIGGSNKATDTTLDLKPASSVDCKNIETDSTEKNEMSVKGATFNETNQFPNDYKSETTESFEEMSKNADSRVETEPSCQDNASKTLVDTSGCLTNDSILESNGISDSGNTNKKTTSVIDDMTDSEAGDDIESDDDTEVAEDMETFALSLDTNNGYKEQTLTIECPELKGTKNVETFEQTALVESPETMGTKNVRTFEYHQPHFLYHHDGTRNEVDDHHQSVENDTNNGYKEQTVTIECPELKGTKNVRTFEHDGTRNEVDDDHQSVENKVNSAQLQYEKVDATSTESVSNSLESSVRNDYLPAKMDAEKIDTTSTESVSNSLESSVQNDYLPAKLDAEKSDATHTESVTISLESSVQNDYLPAKLDAESLTGTAEPPSQDQCTFKSDTDASSMETSYQNPTDPSELYAVCQELLDARHCYNEYNEDFSGAHYQHLLKESSSCHSLEDRNSFLFYGDNRRLSIHSDGSCNSIEDSNAWLTGEVIDLSNVDLSDIVTVIPDEQLDVEQKFKTTNGTNEKFDESVISAKALITDLSNISSDTAKFHLVDTVNTENMVNLIHTARIDEPDLLVSETWKTKTSDGENVISDITKQMSVSQNSDSGFQGDSEFTAGKPRKRKDDAFSSLPDPIDITDSTRESIKVLGANNGSQRKHSRRTMSLDLAHTQSSVPDMYSLSPNDLSLPKSSTMPDGVNEQLTKTARIPRSSTVPELLSGFVTPKLFSVQRNITQSPIQLFRKLPIVKNPFMSPFLAPDDMLQGLPDVHLVACHFDPLLDDSVMFARRLKRLDKNVDLHIFDNLPHGFLNFASASPEAKKAMYYCIDKIKEVLNIETNTS